MVHISVWLHRGNIAYTYGQVQPEQKRTRNQFRSWNRNKMGTEPNCHRHCERNHFPFALAFSLVLFDHYVYLWCTCSKHLQPILKNQWIQQVPPQLLCHKSQIWTETNMSVIIFFYNGILYTSFKHIFYNVWLLWNCVFPFPSLTKHCEKLQVEGFIFCCTVQPD